MRTTNRFTRFGPVPHSHAIGFAVNRTLYTIINIQSLSIHASAEPYHPMIKPLTLTGTATTPAITLDAEKNIFEIAGRSVADNASEVYQPVLQWINQYARDPRSVTLVTIKLEYFNTASSKALLDTLSALSFIRHAKILWYHAEDDDDMKEAGEEFFELVNIPFEFKTY